MEMEAPSDELLTICTTLEDQSLHASVRVKGRMRLRNGMWHDLRNSIIIRNEKYAERLQEINLIYKNAFVVFSCCKRTHIVPAHSRHLLCQSSTVRARVVPIHTCSSCSSCGSCSSCSCFCFEVDCTFISLPRHVNNHMFSGGPMGGT